MARVVDAVVRILSNVLELFTLKARKKDREERKADADAPVQAAEEIRVAAAQGDEAKVNEMLAEARERKQHGGAVRKALTVVVMLVALGGSLALFDGCALAKPKTIVLSADRRVVKMELDGISGWFVPEAQFVDMAAAYVAEAKRLELREAAMETGE